MLAVAAAYNPPAHCCCVIAVVGIPVVVHELVVGELGGDLEDLPVVTTNQRLQQ
jgi:hypothetical protein